MCSQVIDVGPKDAILGILPLFHSLAQMANIMLPLSVGMRVVYLESMNTSELLRALQERDITVFACVPQFFYLILERIQKEVQQKGALVRCLFRAMLAVSTFGRKFGVNLGKVFFGRVHHMLGKRMRYLVTGGSRFDPAVGRQFEAMGFTMLQGYGMTETCGAASVTPPRDDVMGSVGKPLPGNEMKIFDGALSPEHGGASVGEVAFRGGIIMAGYYKRPDATAAMYRDGWLCSGDLGYRDADGNFFITGRKKDVIVLSNGKNIYPEEIEAHYLQSPNIKEICVLGIAERAGRALLRAPACRDRARLRSPSPRQDRQRRRYVALRNRGSVRKVAFDQARIELRDLAERPAPHQHPQDQAFRSRAARETRRRHASRSRRCLANCRPKKRNGCSGPMSAWRWASFRPPPN